MVDSVAMVRIVIRGQDLRALRAFYAAVFGWTAYEVAPGYLDVETVPHEHDERGNDIFPPIEHSQRGGATLWRYEGESSRPRMHQPGPAIGVASGDPGVIPYVEVDDLAATLAKVEAAGGTIVQAITEIPGYTSVARFTDPEGTQIGLQRRITAE